jgi:uncharacterized protein (TIGR02145 family)
MKNIFPLMAIVMLTINIGLSAQETGTLNDPRDGKTYKTIKTGSRTWMAENLAYKMNKGCLEYSDAKNNITFGYLYTWATAKSACPTGWHMPNNNEFTSLLNFLGGDSIAGGKLKEEGTIHWESPNAWATNMSGFTALPGGYWDNSQQTTLGIGQNGIWWSATEFSPYNAFSMILGSGYDRAIIRKASKNFGFSLRCIKD